MKVQDFVYLATLGLCLTGQIFAQQAKVDFGRDVLPIFRQNCIGCHGPALATNGLRLARKSSVFKDGFRRVVPGSLDNSFLYHRLLGGEYGLQMPPTGALRPEQIATIKTWIEQGAEWPDSLSNEAELPPIDPKAVAAVESLRTGDRKYFLKAIGTDPKLLNARGPEGSTPFMYAALYGDATLLDQLLKKGANPNVKNDAGATALMWAAMDLDKARALVAHGADVNAKSNDLRTPLMIAAGLPAGRPTVKLLLEHGANVNPTKRPDSESSPLAQAAWAADPETMRMLIDAGADLKASGGAALTLAITQYCQSCVNLLVSKGLEKDAYTEALQQVANFADVNTIRMLLDHGAKIDAPDPLGHTPLAYAAGSDLIPTDVVKLLIARGANVNSRSPHKSSGDTGMSVLDVARLRGETPVVDALRKAGAESVVADPAVPGPQGSDSPRIAVERSLPLLQRADAGFTSKSGCISCHNDSLAAITTGLARSRGIRVDETISRQQLKYNLASLRHMRDLLHQGSGGGSATTEVFFPHIVAYMLLGFHADGHEPDLDTDAGVMYIKAHQMPDGRIPYPAADTRPPLCSDYIGQTALSLRALQLYAPKQFKPEYDKSIDMAAGWLAKVSAKSTEDHIWKVMGLGWAARDKSATEKARQDLLALQRADGSWGDLPSMPSSAYSTGKALVALNTAGLPVSDPAYQRGVQYLLKNQMGDGSWYVRTRALALQPYFDSGFSHGVHQYISAAGSSWATMALILATPASKPDLRADVQK